MVSTSNCPPLVAMSVVTRWRSTFSSSVTHFTVMSGFLAVKSLVSPCMRIMSPLFTVAMVSVSAIAGTDIDRMAAPTRAPNDGFTGSSQGSRGAYAHALGVCSDRGGGMSRLNQGYPPCAQRGEVAAASQAEGSGAAAPLRFMTPPSPQDGDTSPSRTPRWGGSEIQ